jgi:hypothetical protein
MACRDRRRLAGRSNAPAKAKPENRRREPDRFNLFVDCIKSAGETPNAIYFFTWHTESGVQQLSSVGMAVGKPRTDPEFSKIVRFRTVFTVNASASDLFNTPDLSKKAGPQKSKWH